MNSRKKSSRKVDMAGKTRTLRDIASSYHADPQFRVVVVVVFLINFHTWGMNSVSCRCIELFQVLYIMLILITGLCCFLSLLPDL